MIEFDAAQASPVFPRPIPKNAPLVTVPRTAKGTAIPISVLASWGDAQVFQEDFYAVATDGVVTHGAAATAWRAMYAEVAPGSGYWVKTTPPTGYRSTEPGKVATYVDTPIGRVLESLLDVAPGDWIIRQPGGEVQRVSAGKYPTLYFSQDEADGLGLPEMDAEEFKRWALRQAAWSLMELFSGVNR